MVKSYKSQSFINGLRFSCVNAIKANKIKIFVSFIFVLIAISTGVFIAVKANISRDLCNLREINLDNFRTGFAASSSAFFARSCSLLVNVLLLALLSLSPFLFPLAVAIFTYRGYLFGLNFALIFIFYGIGSMITAVIVILPCQLLTLFVLIMFNIILQKMNTNCKKFGGTDCNRLLFALLAFLVLILINLVETLLLCVLSGNVILVI